MTKSADIIALGRMSETQYDAERAKFAPTKAEAGVRWEQELARLFVRSGWTQQELAKREGKSKSAIDRLLRFGRFLNFPPNGGNPETLPIGLTEGKFRELWDRTDKCGGNERQRFAEVAKLLDSMTLVTPRRPQIGKQIIEHFGDGKWHRLETIVEAIEQPIEHVEETLRKMHVVGTYGCKAERRKYGTSSEWRIFPPEKKISTTELIEKLAPIIKDLKAQGKCNMATMSPAQVAFIAGRLQKLLDEWTE